MEEEVKEDRLNFIEERIENDLKSIEYPNGIITRFPPEPNGYLHIGHAKSICLNFDLAAKYGGKCNLRFDDTNPETEEEEYSQAIKKDIQWLGFNWEDRLYHASDYFESLYDFAVILIKKGKAFVCDMTAEEISEARGVPTSPGQESPFRNRSVEENMKLFEGMKNGLFENGSKTLRAKIDMTSPNMHLRDPALYRIRKKSHFRTNNKWCIYPMYDFAHSLSDALEGITHSICTLEFEVHRPLYDWIIEMAECENTPKQIEFARLNLNYTIMSKRKLLRMVNESHVTGWDDPRMPTISGMRRRGYPAEAIKNFARRVGIAKRNNVIDISLLEFTVREHLNKSADRVMAVLDPLKIVITNYSETKVEQLKAINNPEDESAGTRSVPFTRELYIERADFMEDAPKKFFRLAPGREVRLRYAYYITCNNVVKDEAGDVIELHCTYDPETKGGQSADGRKIKGTLHWVSATEAFKGHVKAYDRLFKDEEPGKDFGGDFIKSLNPDSLSLLTECHFEPHISSYSSGDVVQFERLGYFCVDTDSTSELMVWNKTVGLRDSWAKINKNS